MNIEFYNTIIKDIKNKYINETNIVDDIDKYLKKNISIIQENLKLLDIYKNLEDYYNKDNPISTLRSLLRQRSYVTIFDTEYIYIFKELFEIGKYTLGTNIDFTYDNLFNYLNYNNKYHMIFFTFIIINILKYCILNC